MRYLMMVLIMMAVGCTKGAEMVQQPTLLAQVTIDPYVIPTDISPGAAGGEQFAEWVRVAMAEGVDPYRVLHAQFADRDDHWLKVVSGAIDETAQPSDTVDGPFTSPWWYAEYNKETGEYELDSASTAAVSWWHEWRENQLTELIQGTADDVETVPGQ